MAFRQYNDKILTCFDAVFYFFLKFYVFSFPASFYQPPCLSGSLSAKALLSLGLSDCNY